MSSSTSKIKKQILTLLKQDEEFRYAVAGLIGLEEILKRLDRHSEEIAKLREETNSLREETNKLREETNKLREDMNNLREETNRLREDMNRLREDMNKGFERHDREITKLWEEVKALREGQNKLWDETRRLRSYMVSGFTELKAALGVTYEMHAAAYVEVMLDEMGYTGARVEKKYIVHDGEIIDIDIFCERPLVIGEVKVAIRDKESASREVEKLFQKVDAVTMRYGRTPELIILSVGNASEDVANYLREASEKRGFKLILGREIEEALGPA